jgi:hypothetical protein
LSALGGRADITNWSRHVFFTSTAKFAWPLNDPVLEVTLTPLAVLISPARCRVLAYAGDPENACSMTRNLNSLGKLPMRRAGRPGRSTFECFFRYTLGVGGWPRMGWPPINN